MAAPINPNGGRPKGVPNKATSAAREAIAAFVDGNVDRLTTWLDAIAAKDPKNAFDCFMSVVEYHIPKLARSENETKLLITEDVDALKRGRARVKALKSNG